MGGGQKQAEQPEEEDATALFRLSPLGSAGLSRAVCPQWGCRRLTATAAAQARSKSTMPAMRSTLAKVTRQRVSGRARDWKFAGDDDGQAEAAKQQVKQLREQRKRAMAEKDPRLQRDIAAGQPRRLALQKYTQLRSCRRPATRRTSPPSGAAARARGPLGKMLTSRAGPSPADGPSPVAMQEHSLQQDGPPHRHTHPEYHQEDSKLQVTTAAAAAAANLVLERKWVNSIPPGSSTERKWVGSIHPGSAVGSITPDSATERCGRFDHARSAT